MVMPVERKRAVSLVILGRQHFPSVFIEQLSSSRSARRSNDAFDVSSQIPIAAQKKEVTRQAISGPTVGR